MNGYALATDHDAQYGADVAWVADDLSADELSTADELYKERKRAIEERKTASIEQAKMDPIGLPPAMASPSFTLEYQSDVRPWRLSWVGSDLVNVYSL